MSTDVTVVSDKEGVIFFIVTLVYSGCIAFPYIMHCIHLSRFFGASSENICPIHYTVHSSSQSVSCCISVFSFKIHCLQMLQLFQTKKGSFFFIVTLVYSGCITFPYIMHLYTFVTLFWCFIRKYLSHIFSDSSSQSVSHWNSVFSFKIYCLQMLQLFQTKKGSFFSSSHLYTVVA